ncbi:protein phosphatase 1e [Plakobranchus ocellatus]|uniref:Protein phosphatase 1e n=1 Tax=Plakobranchus ocellatus TaxID=259542 RepID=A0AAV4APU9_9GAST|nr:protein phosphatase 1e [Plakobranchus ocellatus]
MDDEEPITVYSRWLENFGNKIESLSPEDFETPFRLTTSALIPQELEGECLEWTRRYLSLHDCPNGLVYQLSRAVYKSIKGSLNVSRFIIDSGDEGSRDEDEEISDNASQDSCEEQDNKPVLPPQLSASKLLREVVSHVHNVIKTWNRSPPTLIHPPTFLHVCSHSIKNTRRKMEDRHVTITDVNALYDIKNGPSQSYFAVFDGHGGIEAADYAAAHLHNYLVADAHFDTDPAAALKRAYKTTDARFLEKAKRQGLRSGTTGVTALVRGEELHLAWLGDSQALLVRAGQPVQIMDPHKPEREVTNIVYKHSHTSPGGLDDVAIGLVNAARDSGSTDNISVVVVLFKSKLSVPQSTSDSGILLGMGSMNENPQGSLSSTSSSSSSVPQPKPPVLNKKLEGRSKGDARDDVFSNKGSVEVLSPNIQQTPFSHKLMRQVNFYVSTQRSIKKPQDPNLAQLALKQAVSSAGKDRLSRKHKHLGNQIPSELGGSGSSFAKKSPRREARKPKARSLSRQPLLQKGSFINHSRKKKSYGNNVTSFSLSVAGGHPGAETLWGYSDDSDDAWSVSTGLSEDWPPSKLASMAGHSNGEHGGANSKKTEQLLTPLRLKGSSLLQAAIAVEASSASSSWAKNMSSPFLQLSGTTLQLSSRATLPQILPCVPPTPPDNGHAISNSNSLSRSGPLHFSHHHQLSVVPPLWGPSRRLSSLGESDRGDSDARSICGDSMPPPSLGGRKLSVLSDTGLSRKPRRQSGRAKDNSQGLETSRRAH